MAGDDVDDAWGEAGFLDKFCSDDGLLCWGWLVGCEVWGWGASLLTVNGAFSLLFKTTVFPAASAGATFILNIARGKFHGMIKPTTPYGSLTVMLSIPGAWVLAVPWAFHTASAKYRNSSDDIWPSMKCEMGRPVHSVSSRASSSLASMKSWDSLRRYGARPSTPSSRQAGNAALAAATASSTSLMEAWWTVGFC